MPNLPVAAGIRRTGSLAARGARRTYSPGQRRPRALITLGAHLTTLGSSVPGPAIFGGMVMFERLIYQLCGPLRFST